jgi:hypothetical protein
MGERMEKDSRPLTQEDVACLYEWVRGHTRPLSPHQHSGQGGRPGDARKLLRGAGIYRADCCHSNRPSARPSKTIVSRKGAKDAKKTHGVRRITAQLLSTPSGGQAWVLDDWHAAECRLWRRASVSPSTGAAGVTCQWAAMAHVAPTISRSLEFRYRGRLFPHSSRRMVRIMSWSAGTKSKGYALFRLLA